MRSPRPVLAVVVVCGALLAGCGPPPEPEPLGPPPPPAPATAAPTGPPVFVPNTPLTPRPPGVFPDDQAVACDGRPEADQVLDLLRAEGYQVTDGTVTRGPVCAGTWQYSVVTVPELDPLQVVTRGDPDDLELVTAGTNVCTVDVRVLAPPGIRAAAACVG